MGALRRFRRSLPAAVLLVLAALPTPGQGQLISPGRLSSVHTELEGIRNCTQCHEFRQRGISATRCLDCHSPLARRLESGTGYHASLPDADCATCHKEHLGEAFQLVRFDSLAFDHTQASYALDGRHAETGCRDCHTPALIQDAGVRSFKAEHGALERTYLGLPRECATCHEADTPHRDQFQDRVCTDCHDTGGWQDAAGFDHDQVDYRLTGAHRTAPCAGCHTAEPNPGELPDFVRYQGVVAARCNDCHEDPHAASMPGACASCHETGGWRRVRRDRVEATYDHRVTGFELEGRHGAAPCASCHDASAAASLVGVHLSFQPGTAGNAFPRPVATACRSCHVDRHEGAFEDGESGGDPPDCVRCHGEAAWSPADYDALRHNREAGWALEGAHLTVACDACHLPTGDVPTFRVEDTTCAGCHRDADPHGDQFQDRSCDACHDLGGFRIAEFDHTRTRYPLEGAHVRVPCAGCHTPEPAGPDGAGDAVVRYRPLGTECRDCHEGVS